MIRLSNAFRNEFRRGWLVLLICFVCMLVSIMAPTVALPFIYPQVIREFGWSHAETMLFVSTKYVVGSVAAILVGQIVDRIGVWWIMLATTVVTGLAMLSFLWINSLADWYLAGFLLGFSAPGGVVCVKVMVSKAFHSSQGTAMAIALLGVSGAGIVVPLAATFSIEAFGWRGGYAALSVGLWAVALPLVLLGLVTARWIDAPQPADVGSDTGSSPSQPQEDDGGFWDIIRGQNFWLTAAALLLAAAVDSGLQQHQVLIFQEAGIPALTIAMGVSAIGLLSIPGRIAVGYILDRTSNRGLAFLFLSLSLAAVSGMALGLPAIFLAFLAFRAVGNSVVLLDSAVMAKHIYGFRHLGVILGIFTAIISLGFALGPWMVGAIFDLTGTYRNAFLLFMAMPLLSATLIWFVRPVFWEGLRRDA